MDSSAIQRRDKGAVSMLGIDIIVYRSLRCRSLTLEIASLETIGC